MEQELIIRGNNSDKIIEYFENLASLECDEEVTYDDLNFDNQSSTNEFKYAIQSLNWLVKLTHEVDIYIGAMVFPEVIVRISAPENFLEELVYNFRIQFLSAGG